MAEPLFEPRKRSGFMTFMYVLLGVGAVLAVTCGVGAYVFVNSETGKRFMAGAQESIVLIEKAQKAPGAAELRDLGCGLALVVRVGDMATIVETFRGGEDSQLTDANLAADTPVVVCDASGGRGAGIDCATAAARYRDAAAPSGDFLVMVQKRGGDCEARFAADGALLEDLSESESESEAEAEAG